MNRKIRVINMETLETALLKAAFLISNERTGRNIRSVEIHAINPYEHLVLESLFCTIDISNRANATIDYIITYLVFKPS